MVTQKYPSLQSPRERQQEQEFNDLAENIVGSSSIDTAQFFQSWGQRMIP